MSAPENPEYPHQDLFIPYIDYHRSLSFLDKLQEAQNIIYHHEARKKFSMMLDRVTPDIVHLHNFAHQISPSILPVLREYKIPAVMTMHDYKLVCPVYTLLSRGKLCERCRKGHYYHCVLRRCTKGSMAKSLVNTIEMYVHHHILHLYEIISYFISPSVFLADKVRSMGFRGKIMHIPNALDSAALRPADDEPKNEFLYFGRLSWEKGLRTLVDAVIDSKEIFLKIIGDGPQRRELEQAVHESGCDRIRFLGFLYGEALREEIRQSIAVVLPSEWYENCPLSVLESFALGKPVIGARIGGIPELVREGSTGITFTAGNSTDLREKMETLLQNPLEATKMGREARLLVEHQYNPSVYYESLLQVYSSAMKGYPAQT
jgi:glycosyltransferase involved in cell wall biosynthesis